VKKYLLEKYAGKKVLVTGHTGFKGSWLVFILNHLGSKVYGFSLDEPSDFRHVYHALSIGQIIQNPKAKFGDVRDSAQLKKLIESVNPDFIFHLAAQAIVSKSFADPVDTVSTNIIGTLNILELVRTTVAHSTLVLVTSDKCYRNTGERKSYTESDELGGSDIYSASKASAELVIRAYFEMYPNVFAKSGASSVRAGNVFGGGDWSENRLVPDCVRASIRNEALQIRMPNATRPWTAVQDILVGYLTLAIRTREGLNFSNEPWNFAATERMTVLEVGQEVNRSLGAGAPIEFGRLADFREEEELQIDPSKAIERLGWKTKFPLKQSLARTSEWYVAQLNGEDMTLHTSLYLTDFLGDS